MTTRRFMMIVLAAWCTSAGAEDNESTNPNGLTVLDGDLWLRGEPYRGVGVNYFSLFYRTLHDPTDRSYEIGLQQLAQAEIPFVRFMAGGFWPIDWDLYGRDRPAYFALLDAIVRSAEQTGVGLIPSLFWHGATVPDLVGEPIDQLGNPDSKTLAFIRQYTEEVVLRYRHSSAIWAWEFGNEYNLAVDLPNASVQRPKVVPSRGTARTRSARDELSSQAMRTALMAFAVTVRRHDPHRILITGNAIPRASAYHNSEERSWKKDSLDQFNRILLRDNPDPFEALSVHLYRHDGQAGATDLSSLVRVLQDTSSRSGKPLFVGEFGAPETLGSTRARERFLALLNAIETHDVPLSALWVFDHPEQGGEWNVTFANSRAYMLDHIRQVNQRMRSHR